MANYLVTTWVSSVKPLNEALTEAETYIETIDDTKAIISYDAVTVNDNARVFIVHRT